MKNTTKEKLIRKFIGEESPTPKELRYFCKEVKPVDYLYTKMVEETQDVCNHPSNTYQALQITGYYGTNIAQWRRYGNIAVVDGKYQLSQDFLKTGKSLYTLSDAGKLKIANRRVMEYTKELRSTRSEYYKLVREIQDCRDKLESAYALVDRVCEDIPRWTVSMAKYHR